MTSLRTLVLTTVVAFAMCAQMSWRLVPCVVLFILIAGAAMYEEVAAIRADNAAANTLRWSEGEIKRLRATIAMLQRTPSVPAGDEDPTSRYEVVRQ